MSKIVRDWIIVSVAMIAMIVALNGGIIWYSYKLQDERYSAETR
jgi:hypothetical protein